MSRKEPNSKAAGLQKIPCLAPKEAFEFLQKSPTFLYKSANRDLANRERGNVEI